MSRNSRSLRIAFCIFVFVLLAVVFFSRQFAPPAESAVQPQSAAPEKGKLENYDIRTDKSETARAAIEKYALDAGKTAAQIADARKSVSDAAERMRAARTDLKIEYNEDLRIPEVLSPDYAAGAGFLSAPANEKRTAVLENFLRQNAALFGLAEAQISALRTTSLERDDAVSRRFARRAYSRSRSDARSVAAPARQLDRVNRRDGSRSGRGLV